MKQSPMDEICKNCGLTKGAHSASDYDSDIYKMHVPYDCCPGHQSRMDWDKGPGSVFEGTGEFMDIPYGTPAKGVKE